MEGVTTPQLRPRTQNPHGRLGKDLSVRGPDSHQETTSLRASGVTRRESGHEPTESLRWIEVQKTDVLPPPYTGTPLPPD